ncbi:hypothetical protein I350_04529 [Cryptococcus amylolentus CBS 6273]|uniref:Cullin family profile domain-containing protein n=1 Tax=Cryptococcus amylolentus CBS 6273 TaxID=1296118 RepID=A0A1E3JX83_9TREE|nr:hypothetical protein I350_08403 [Cryptococcus amylolentus CBS 6273]ODO05478.1 hypothetical protein I350_04529 [Cryptococcus amylolentus CBS 6273]
MPALIQLPSRSNAFSRYTPSKNAYNDFINPALAAQSTVPTVSLHLPSQPQSSIHAQIEPLAESIKAILTFKPTPVSYHHISTLTRNIALKQPDLNKRVLDTFEQELVQTCQTITKELRRGVMARDKGILAKITQEWRSLKQRTDLLRSLLVYLDPPTAIEPLNSRVARVFRQQVWEDDILSSARCAELLDWLALERASSPSPSNPQQRQTIKDNFSLSRDLSLHSFEVETEKWLDATREYYLNTCQRKIAGIASHPEAAAYISWYLQSLKEEVCRAQWCVSMSFAEEVAGNILKETSEEVEDGGIILSAVYHALSLASDGSALAEVYEYTTNVMAFDILVSSVESFCKEKVGEIALRGATAKDEKEKEAVDGELMVWDLLALRRRINALIDSLFPPSIPDPTDGKGKAPLLDSDGDALMSSPPTRAIDEKLSKEHYFELSESVRTGFKAGLAKREAVPAEYVAKYLDRVMRRGSVKPPPSSTVPSDDVPSFQSHLSEIVHLSGLLLDKDVFKAFYGRSLAKRLLLSKSASDDSEKGLVRMLQKEMGEEFTAGDIMMKDLQVSETLVKAYQTANPSSNLNFTTNVLTESAWPASSSSSSFTSTTTTTTPVISPFRLPQVLQNDIASFEAWYKDRYKNRVLAWRWGLGSVTMTARFGQGAEGREKRYEIGVSLYQAVVLIMFNDNDHLTVKDIGERSGIPVNELTPTLQSLALGKKGTRVLLKKPPRKEVKDSDVFGWNKSFSGDKFKFRINGIQQDISAEESKSTQNQISLDRTSILEATLVRLMKARKRLSLQLLIDAVVGEVSKRFPPDVKEIKKRVESLIEREFLERDEEDRGVLKYVA